MEKFITPYNAHELEEKHMIFDKSRNSVIPRKKPDSDNNTWKFLTKLILGENKVSS